MTKESQQHTLVYLIRHAEPALPNREKRFVGRSDPPLSTTGIEQARRLANRLCRVHFDSIHSSDLRRCLDTARIIADGEAKTGSRRQNDEPSQAIIPEETQPPVAPPILANPQLREIDAGLWEWLTFDEAQRLHPREFSEREHDLTGYRFPGGESFHDLRDRVVPAFKRIINGGGENILVVAHLGVNRVLLCEFLGLPLEELFSIKQGYADIDLIKATALPDRSHRIEVVTASRHALRADPQP